MKRKNNKGELTFFSATVIFTIAVFTLGILCIITGKNGLDKKAIESKFNEGEGLYVTYMGDDQIQSIRFNQGNAYVFKNGEEELAYTYKIKRKDKSHSIVLKSVSNKYENVKYPVSVEEGAGEDEKIIIVTVGNQRIKADTMRYYDRAATESVNSYIKNLLYDIECYDLTTIESQIKAYENLTDWDKKFLLKADLLYKAENHLNEKEADRVNELIAAIGSVNENSIEAVNAAREAYDALTDVQKEYVDKYSVLEAAEKSLNAMLIDKANKLIAVLEDKEAWTIENVRKATEAYEKLNSEQKKSVKHEVWLTNALEEIDKVAANEFDKKVSEALSEKITWESEELVTDLKSSYEALTSSQLSLIKAEAPYKNIISTYEEEIVTHCKHLIMQIGTVNLSSASKVENAAAYYEALPDEKKAEVDNYDVLAAAQEEIAALKEIESHKFNVGDVIKGSQFEVKLISVGFEEKISPDSPSWLFLEKTPTSEDQIFVDICVNIKNISTSSANISDALKIKKLYLGDVAYDKTVTIFDTSNSTMVETVYFFDSMEPLSQKNYHFTVMVPKSERLGGKPLYFECEIAEAETKNIVLR